MKQNALEKPWKTLNIVCLSLAGLTLSATDDRWKQQMLCKEVCRPTVHVIPHLSTLFSESWRVNVLDGCV